MKIFVMLIVILSLCGCGESAREKEMREAAERRKEHKEQFKFNPENKSLRPKLSFGDEFDKKADELREKSEKTD